MGAECNKYPIHPSPRYRSKVRKNIIKFEIHVFHSLKGNCHYGTERVVNQRPYVPPRLGRIMYSYQDTPVYNVRGPPNFLARSRDGDVLAYDNRQVDSPQCLKKSVCPLAIWARHVSKQRSGALDRDHAARQKCPTYVKCTREIRKWFGKFSSFQMSDVKRPTGTEHHVARRKCPTCVREGRRRESQISCASKTRRLCRKWPGALDLDQVKKKKKIKSHAENVLPQLKQTLHFVSHEVDRAWDIVRTLKTW